MRVKEITLKKEYKLGLPNFSNITAGVYMTWELDETEQFDFDQGWDIINQQVQIQVDTTDPAWIRTEEFKNKYKATVNIPKSREVK